MNKTRCLVVTVVAVATLLFLIPSCTTSTNNQPIIGSLESESELVGPQGNVQVTCSASDPDGDEVSYEWSASAGEVSGNGNTATWMAPPSEGSYSVAVTVTDGRGGVVMDYVTITVRGNNPPGIASLTVDAQWSIPSNAIQVTCVASDLDGDELSYEWSASGGEISGEGDTVTWAAPSSAGSYDIAVTVTDEHGGVTTDYLTITVRTNDAPTIAGLTVDAEWSAPSGSIQVMCTASDADGDELSYDWSASEGQTNGEGETVTWTAPAHEGSYTVAVVVTDGYGGEVMDSVTITVRINDVPTIASLTADPDWTTPWSNLQLTCSASDLDGDELSYHWSATAGFIAGTGPVVNWIAPQGAGVYDITVVVTDGYGGSDTRTESVTVLTGEPPTIEILLITAEHCYLKPYSGGYYVGKQQMYDIECVVADTNIELFYEWSCTGAACSGEDSLITWIAPNEPVFVTVTVTVSDISGSMASESMVLSVVPCSYCIFGC